MTEKLFKIFYDSPQITPPPLIFANCIWLVAAGMICLTPGRSNLRKHGNGTT